jgi:hypothetical protein
MVERLFASTPQQTVTMKDAFNKVGLTQQYQLPPGY